MPSSTSLPGARIGKYRLLAHVATGGMGAVYKAHDEENDRVVALKILAPDLAKNEILVERFKREARHAARMAHRNLVKLYESDTIDGTHFIAMEFIEGIDLAEYIRRKGKLEPEEARRILIQACKAIDHAFAMGVTHRDIKPSNFLLANDQGRTRVKLTDLGLARMINEEEFRVTRAGTTVGTVDYMSPEQARDSSLADVRSDIYSLGCTMYHMLAGQPPFAEGGIGERIYKHMAADPPDVRQLNPHVSVALWTVLRRMLAKHMDDRFQTPQELIDALRSISHADAQPRKTRRDPTSDSETLVEEMPRPRPGEPARRPPSSAPEVKARPGRKPIRPPGRKSTIPELKSNTVADVPDPFGLTAEQRLAAAGQFSRATDLIGAGGGGDYAVQLLISCVKLDPANTLYRKMLREVVRDHGAKKSGWFGALSHRPARSRLRAANKAGDYRKVLEEGEEFLTRVPNDVPTQLEMAEAAQALGVGTLAVWLLEYARSQTPKDPAVLRALAALYEDLHRYPQAIAQWEKLKELDPADPEPGNKIRELAVNDTLYKGRYRDREGE
ncbi:MAG: protein kinase [Gemmataceae bacterium]